jgi:hypothetical protein
LKATLGSSETAQGVRKRCREFGNAVGSSETP